MALAPCAEGWLTEMSGLAVGAEQPGEAAHPLWARFPVEGGDGAGMEQHTRPSAYWSLM